jgi:hypothetical protein
MVAVTDVVGILLILGVNTALAALLTRFFRVRMKTRWGAVLYALLITPVVQLLVILVLSGIANLGGPVGSAAAVVGLFVLLPMGLGMAFDYFWQPAPEEVELPDRLREQGR